MDKRIVYTRPDGGVSVVVPSSEFIAGATGGGRLIAPCDRDEQIRRWQIPVSDKGPGLPAAVAIRYVDACICGGLSLWSALHVLIASVVPQSASGIEIWNVSDISSDRWFRDAWRRDLNGGPIFIDLDAARVIQAQRIAVKRDAVIRHLAVESDQQMLLGRGSNILSYLLDAWRDLPLREIGQKIIQGKTADEIRSVFDLELFEDDPEAILNWRLPT